MPFGPVEGMDSFYAQAVELAYAPFQIHVPMASGSRCQSDSDATLIYAFWNGDVAATAEAVRAVGAEALFPPGYGLAAGGFDQGALHDGRDEGQAAEVPLLEAGFTCSGPPAMRGRAGSDHIIAVREMPVRDGQPATGGALVIAGPVASVRGTRAALTRWT